MATEGEAALAVSLGASAVGLVSAMPSGPGPIPDEHIARIVRTVPPVVHTVLLTSRRHPHEIIAHQRLVGTSVIQIVDQLGSGSVADIRAQIPHVKLVQVVHITGPEAIGEAVRVSGAVDALLLDSGRPQLPVKELGGTGRRHDWSISRTIVETVGIPVFLAGGLRADNVREAIDTVLPFGIDVCSGVRTDGALDPGKVRAFMLAAGIELAPIRERMFP